MGRVSIDHTAFLLCTKTCQIFQQCMVFSLYDFEIPWTKAEQVARFPDLSSPWGGRYSVRQSGIGRPQNVSSSHRNMLCGCAFTEN